MTLSAKEQFIKALAAATVEEIPDAGLYCFENVVCIAIPSEDQIPFDLADDEIYIVGLTSHAQRTEQRNGSRAMAFLGQLADQFNIALTLNALPIGKDVPSQEKLYEFYGKQGFERVEGEGSFMRREPRGPALDNRAA